MLRLLRVALLPRHDPPTPKGSHKPSDPGMSLLSLQSTLALLPLADTASSSVREGHPQNQPSQHPAHSGRFHVLMKCTFTNQKIIALQPNTDKPRGLESNYLL